MDAIHTHHEHEHDHDHAQENRSQIMIKAGLLFGLAAYFAWNILSGNLANYINARFAWLSYLAVILFAALGVACLLALRNQHDHDDHAHHHDHDDHVHERVTLPMLIVVAVPLILGTLIPSAPLGAAAIDSISFGARSYAVGSPTLASKPPLERDILDWSRQFIGDQPPSSFNDLPARVLGFVYREPSFPENTFMVARFTLSCCVADASALGLPARLPDGMTVEDGAWVWVEGAFKAEAFLDQDVPVLQIASIEPTEQPEHPYLYP
jgi:uncharacterized repeat protein (TIGR03943 family)